MIMGRHYQNAYVTRDIDKAIREFRERAKVRSESYYEGAMPVSTPEGEAIMHNKIAFMWVDDLQYEFIEPIAGLEHIYDQALPDHDGILFHHICMRVADWDELQRHLAANAFPVPFQGEAPGGLRFLYVDARSYCGHFLEYTWMPQEMWIATGGR